MAVTSVALTLTDNGQWSGEKVEGYARKYSVSYQVICDDKHDGPVVVLAAAGLPALYSTYAVGNDADPQARCTKLTPRLVSRSKTGNIWAVDCEYSTQVSENNSNSDPTQWLPKISGTYTQFMKALEQDNDGNAITTAAGEIFDPVPEQEDSRPTLVVTKIFSSFDYVFFADYRDKVNSDTWVVRGLSFAPDYLKVQNIGFSEVFINGTSYFEVVASFEVKPDKWNPRKWLNHGFYSLWPVDHKGNPLPTSVPKKIIDRMTGLPHVKEQRLRANGAVVQSLDEPATYVERNTYERRPFSSLNLH